MQKEERQKFLLESIKKDGFISISKTAHSLGVSLETIRRDINLLAEEKKLLKVRGGAASIQQFSKQNSPAKKHKETFSEISIGAEAAKYITDGRIVFLDCGISIQNIVSSIAGIHNVTFITNSVSVMSILLERFSSGDITGRIIMLGGEIDTRSHFSKGAIVTDSIDKYYADIAFISCAALSAESVSNRTLDECDFSSHMMNRSVISVLIAESEKLGKVSVCSFAKPSDFDIIITDNILPVPQDILKTVESSHTHLIISEINI